MKYTTAIIASIVLITLTACTSYDSYVSGNSSVLSNHWRSKIVDGETTLESLIDLLGQPSGYYHRTPNNGEMYLFYHSSVDTKKYRHSPFFPKAQFSSNRVYERKIREWFLFSKGIFAEQISSTSTDEDPNLKDYIRGTDENFPYSDKCSLQQIK